MPLNGIQGSLVGRRCRQRLRSVIATKWKPTCLMSSMSESEIHAVMEEQARKKQEDQRKFLEYRSKTQGDLDSLGWHFRC